MSTAPISHRVNVRKLPRKGRDEAFEADAEARERIARHLDVLAVHGFEADAEIVPWRGEGVRVSGRVTADLTQTCVVTADPIETHVDEPFDALFVPEGSPLAPRMEGDAQLVVDAEGDDPPETFAGDVLDLGAVWIEFLTLAVDPFPRTPGAELEQPVSDEEPSPFAALAALAANANARDE